MHNQPFGIPSFAAMPAHYGQPAGCMPFQPAQPAPHGPVAFNEPSVAATAQLPSAILQPFANTAPQSACSVPLLDSHIVTDAADKSRLPAFVRHLFLQTPPEGMFDSGSLQWQLVADNRWAYAAALPEHRLQSFFDGEEARGACRLSSATDGCTMGMARNDRVACCYASDRHSARVQRQELLPTDEPLRKPDGTAGRKNANQRGTSFSKGCRYGCYVKGFKKLPGIVVIKFACEAPDAAIAAAAQAAIASKGQCAVPAISASGMCPSMLHTTPDGLPAHDGELLHRQEHTAETQELVLEKLRGRMKTATIKAGAFLYITTSHFCTGIHLKVELHLCSCSCS